MKNNVVNTMKSWRYPVEFRHRLICRYSAFGKTGQVDPECHATKIWSCIKRPDVEIRANTENACKCTLRLHNVTIKWQDSVHSFQFTHRLTEEAQMRRVCDTSQPYNNCFQNTPKKLWFRFTFHLNILIKMWFHQLLHSGVTFFGQWEKWMENWLPQTNQIYMVI